MIKSRYSWISGACSAILSAALIVTIAAATSGCTSTDTTNMNSSKSTSNSSEQTSETNVKEIYNDKLIKMSFIKKYDMPGMEGEFFFTAKVENKTKKKISIYLKDVYLNDTNVHVGSAVPLDILPGKNGCQTWFTKYEGTGASKASDIKKIGFKIWVTDEHTKTLETTKNVEIKF